MNNIKNANKGFTLLELLVVVLIIGILAAIALPQYKMAVGKSKFIELKSLTKAVAESVQRYYLANNVYPNEYEDLDIVLHKTQSSHSSSSFEFTLSNSVGCAIWKSGRYIAACNKKIFGKKISYYLYSETLKSGLCLVHSKDTSDYANRLCQKETRKKTGAEYSTYYSYTY